MNEVAERTGRLRVADAVTPANVLFLVPASASFRIDMVSLPVNRPRFIVVSLW